MMEVKSPYQPEASARLRWVGCFSARSSLTLRVSVFVLIEWREVKGKS